MQVGDLVIVDIPPRPQMGTVISLDGFNVTVSIAPLVEVTVPRRLVRKARPES